MFPSGGCWGAGTFTCQRRGSQLQTKPPGPQTFGANLESLAPRSHLLEDELLAIRLGLSAMNLFGVWSKTSFVAANQAATGMETNNSSKNLQSLNRNKICWCDNSGWLVLQITTLVLMIQTVDVCLQRHAELETEREMARRKMTTNLLL